MPRSNSQVEGLGSGYSEKFTYTKIAWGGKELELGALNTCKETRLYWHFSKAGGLSLSMSIGIRLSLWGAKLCVTNIFSIDNCE